MQSNTAVSTVNIPKPGRSCSWTYKINKEAQSRIRQESTPNAKRKSNSSSKHTREAQFCQGARAQSRVSRFASRRNKAHKNLWSSSRVVTKQFMTLIKRNLPWWILPQVIRDIHISPCLSCPWFLAERDYSSKSINISACIHKHPGMPVYREHSWLSRCPIFTFGKIWLSLALVI